MRVLINGGNHAAHEHFVKYDIDQLPVQKKYNTQAAAYFRNLVQRSLDPAYASQMAKPSLQDGKKPST